MSMLPVLMVTVEESNVQARNEGGRTQLKRMTVVWSFIMNSSFLFCHLVDPAVLRKKDMISGLPSTVNFCR